MIARVLSWLRARAQRRTGLTAIKVDKLSAETSAKLLALNFEGLWK